MNNETKDMTRGVVFIGAMGLAGAVLTGLIAYKFSGGTEENIQPQAAITRSTDNPSLNRSTDIDGVSVEVAEDNNGEGMVYGKASYINYKDGTPATTTQRMVDRIKRQESLQYASALHKDVRLDPNSFEVGLEEPVRGRDLPKIGSQFGSVVGGHLMNQMRPGLMTFRKPDGTIGTIRATFGPTTNESAGQFSLDDELFWIVKAAPLENWLAEVSTSKYGLLYPLERALYQKNKIAEAIRLLCDQLKIDCECKPTPIATAVPPTEVTVPTTVQRQEQSQSQRQEQRQEIIVNIPPVATGVPPTSVPPTETSVLVATSTLVPTVDVPTPSPAPTNIEALPTLTPGATATIVPSRTPGGPTPTILGTQFATVVVQAPTTAPTNTETLPTKTVGRTSTPVPTRTPGAPIPTALGTPRPVPTSGGGVPAVPTAVR